MINKSASELNEHQIDAAATLLRTMQDLPLSTYMRYECRGIVGGDFDVTIKRVQDRRDHSFVVEVLTRGA